MYKIEQVITDLLFRYNRSRGIREGHRITIQQVGA
jgi:hypothetical protein